MNDPARKIQFCKGVAAIALMPVLTLLSACTTPKPRRLSRNPRRTLQQRVRRQCLPQRSLRHPPLAPASAHQTLHRAHSPAASWSELPGWGQDNQAKHCPRSSQVALY